MLDIEGFVREDEEIDGVVYCKLHCSFPRLCKEAERVKLQMPLTNVSQDWLVKIVRQTSSWFMLTKHVSNNTLEFYRQL